MEGSDRLLPDGTEDEDEEQAGSSVRLRRRRTELTPRRSKMLAMEGEARSVKHYQLSDLDQVCSPPSSPRPPSHSMTDSEPPGAGQGRQDARCVQHGGDHGGAKEQRRDVAMGGGTGGQVQR
eukprot:768634-Hanusia_phi.AAC.3